MLQPARRLEPALVAQRDEQLVLLARLRSSLHRPRRSSSACSGRTPRPRGARASRAACPCTSRRAPRTSPRSSASPCRSQSEISCVVLGRVAEDVDGDERLRARRDRGLDRGRIEVERARVDVGEHRRRAFVDRAVRGRDERVGRRDHLVPGADARRGACRDAGRPCPTRPRRSAARRPRPRTSTRSAARSARARASPSAAPRARAPRRARRSTAR